MAKTKITVEVLLSRWTCSDVEPTLELSGGKHELELGDRGKDLAVLRALVAAEAAGSVKLKAPTRSLSKERARLGDDDAERADLERWEAHEGYQAALEAIRVEQAADLNASAARVRDAVDAALEDNTDAARDELQAALQERAEVEGEFHKAAAKARGKF